MKIESSFQGVNNSDKAAGKKKSKTKRIVKAAVVAGVAVGAVALYKNRKAPFVQNFVNTINNDILAPLKQKGVPFKDKISNIGENLRNTIGSFTSKRNGYDDVIVITQPVKNGGIQRQPLALPEKASETYGEALDSSLKNMLYKNDGQPVLDIPVRPAADSVLTEKIYALPAPKTVLALPEKASAAGEGAAVRTVRKAVLPETPSVIELPGEIAQDVAEPVKTMGDKIADAAFAGLGASVLVAGGTGAVKAAAEDEGEDEKASVEASEASVQPKQISAKSDKITNITLDGKEFEGIFEDGKAYDGEAEPLTGKLAVSFESGKAVVVQYENGVIKKSVIFKNANDETPKEIKTYKDGKIYQIFKDISLQDGAYVAKTTLTYRASDSMLQSRAVKHGKVTRTKMFKNSLDEEGKINGAPVPFMTTSVQYLSDGTERRKFYAEIKGDTKDGTRLARISDARPDGSKKIEFIGNNKKSVGSMILDNDRKIRWYITNPNSPSDSYLYINEEGKLGAASTSMKIAGNEHVMDYVDYKYTKTKVSPLRPLKDGEDYYKVPHEKTSYYKDTEGSVLAITTYDGGEYVKKIETFKKEGDTEPKTSVTYSKSDKISADYHEYESSVTGRLHTKISVHKDDSTGFFPTLEKLDCSDKEKDVYKKLDGSVVEVKKDEKGFVTSIAVYSDEEAVYPECITTFDHGTPLKDTIYDSEGGVVFSASYNLKPVPKQTVETDEHPEPKKLEKAEYKRDTEGYVRFNDTYNEKTFYCDIWDGEYYHTESVKTISRDEEDVYRVTLLNPYSDSEPVYTILLDQDKKVQKLDIPSSVSEDVEIFMDERGYIERDTLNYAINKKELTRVGPFNKNGIERYQANDGGVIEFVKDKDGAVVSIAYYEDAKKNIPVCRTFLKDGAPQHDIVYDNEDGTLAHTSDYTHDMENVENPLIDVRVGKMSPLTYSVFTRDGKPYSRILKCRYNFAS